jgi:hypothetical protein
MLSSFRLNTIAKTVVGSLTDFCLLPIRLLDAAPPALVPVRVVARRRAATEFRHAAASHPPIPRITVYWPSRRTRPLARAYAIARAFLATDRLPIAKPKVPAR